MNYELRTMKLRTMKLRTTNYELRTKNYELRTTNYELRTTNYELRTTNFLHMRNILWLPSWYPNELTPFDGDFIQRHAQSVAVLHRVEVLHVINDKSGKVTDYIKEEVSNKGNLTERIIYYKPLTTGIGFVDKILSSVKYMRLYKKAVQKYIAVEGKPSFVHVHIAMKAGVIAIWLKKKFAANISTSLVCYSRFKSIGRSSC